MPRPRALTVLAATLAASLLGGCSSYPQQISQAVTAGLTRVVKPFKVDIVQGNVVTQEQLALIKPGTSRNDVRDLIGSPLIADPFHADRWDYVFTFRRDGVETMARHFVVKFKDDLVAEVEAPTLPTEREFVASIATEVRGNTRKLSLSEAEQAALPAPKPVAAPVPTLAAPVGAKRTYPPLEAL
jgi:outer membrane protein assembly factor BamE